MASDRRIPVLDGVRGIAVLIVLMVHFLPDVQTSGRIQEWFKKSIVTTGWIGVDLFFVLSGFLITGILLKARGAPNYFGSFYMRRALRIFPLYYGALIVVFLVLPSLGILGGLSFQPVAETQAYHWLYLTNVGWWMVGPNAFESDHILLRHFWSLAIEEHFYLLWPAVVFFVKARSLKWICIALFGSAFLLRCLALHLGADGAFYYLTPCRWDGLAAGAFVAILLHEDGIEKLRAYARSAVILICFCATYLAFFFVYLKGLWFSSAPMRTFGLSAVDAMFGAAILLVIVFQGGLIGRLVAIRPLRFLGKYSYGLYVIHGVILPTLLIAIPTGEFLSWFGAWPMLGAFALAGVKIAISLALAMLSWHSYEKQFLRMKRHFDYRTSEPLDRLPAQSVTAGAGR